MTVSIRTAKPEDWTSVAALLQAATLVALDETAQFGEQYAIAVTAEGAVIGVAGYERYGADILLRSVTVAEEHRSAGIGARLAADRLAQARSNGCTNAWLLTDTAAGYWARQGFEMVDRNSAPPAISRSHEWSSACPVSAIAMRMVLVKE